MPVTGVGVSAGSEERTLEYAYAQNPLPVGARSEVYKACGS